MRGQLCLRHSVLRFRWSRSSYLVNVEGGQGHLTGSMSKVSKAMCVTWSLPLASWRLSWRSCCTAASCSPASSPPTRGAFALQNMAEIQYTHWHLRYKSQFTWRQCCQNLISVMICRQCLTSGWYSNVNIAFSSLLLFHTKAQTNFLFLFWIKKLEGKKIHATLILKYKI